MPLAAGEAVSAAPHPAQAACLDGQNLASAPDGQRKQERSKRPADDSLASKPFLGGLRDCRTGDLPPAMSGLELTHLPRPSAPHSSGWPFVLEELGMLLY